PSRADPMSDEAARSPGTTSRQPHGRRPVAIHHDLDAAIEEHVQSGMTLAIEGFSHLIPFAAGHTLLRAGRTDLTLIRMTPDLLVDQLIGAGMVSKLTFSWSGNPGLGSLPRFRDAVENAWPRPLEID